MTDMPARTTENHDPADLDDRYAELVGLLVDTFRPFGWTTRSLAGYLAALGDLPYDLVRRATVDAIRTHDKMPAPATLRRLALALVTTEAPDPDTAWTEVRDAFGRTGRTGTPAWSHPAIGRAVAAIGGWARLCLSTDPTGDRIAFARAYRTLADRAEHEALTSTALGAAGHHLQLVGHHLAELDHPA